MATAQAFLDAIRETPDDDTPRLVFSDWLEEHADETRAEFIRVQCELARGVKNAKRRESLQRRERELLLAHELDWLGVLRPVLRRATFQRGFVEGVTVHASRMDEVAPLLGVAPIRHLILLDSRDLIEVVKRPELKDITTLDLRDGCTLSAKGIRAFATASHLQNVSHLLLRQRRLNAAAIGALAKTPSLERLRTLDLYDATWDRLVPLPRLAQSPHLAKLTTLILGGNELGDEGVATITAPGYKLAALRRLHLTYGHIGDEGARALARSEHLEDLETLDLTGNEIGGVAARALRARFGARAVVVTSWEDRLMARARKSSAKSPSPVEEAVLAEDALEQASRESATQAARQSYQPLPARTLQEMRDEKFFPDWSGYTSPANLRLSRRIVRDLIDDLLAAAGDEVSQFDAFRRAVERFNTADNGDDPFIETIEREEICELLDEIADAAGLTDYEVTAWRDW